MTSTRAAQLGGRAARSRALAGRPRWASRSGSGWSPGVSPSAPYPPAARAASWTGRRRSRSPLAGCAPRPGGSPTRELARGGTGVRGSHGAHRAAAGGSARDRPAGRGGAARGGRPGGLGTRQHRRLPGPRRPPRGRLALRRPAPLADRAASRWSPTGSSPPARSASCWLTSAPGCSASTTSRCCPRRRRRAGCCSWRRTSAPPRERWACPLDDFRTWIALHEATHAFELEAHPWLRPYLRERLERQIARSWTRRGRSRRGASATSSERWRAAAAEGLDHGLHVARAARPAARDPARDEPDGGLQRLGHGRRGRSRLLPDVAQHPRAVRAAP